MNRKLLILLFCLSCSSFRPADPLLIEHALQNESDEGFISREFFQVKVEVPYSFKEMSGKAKREECKKVAYLEREEKVLKFLLDVHRDKYRFGDGVEAYEKSKLGQNRAARNKSYTSPTGLPVTTSTSTSQSPIPTNQQTVGTTQTTTNPSSQNQNSNQKDSKDKLGLKSKTYSQVFAWFMGEMFLYKEDYTDKSKCTFLFRNIQKDLFAKVENTMIPDSVYKKEERNEEEDEDTNKKM